VANGIPLGCPLLLPVGTVTSIQTLKAMPLYLMTCSDTGNCQPCTVPVPCTMDSAITSQTTVTIYLPWEGNRLQCLVPRTLDSAIASIPTLGRQPLTVFGFRLDFALEQRRCCFGWKPIGV
jgi:hypothetical protein